MLRLAKKRGVIESVPELEALKTSKPDFDFLDFGEAERLVAAAHDDEFGLPKQTIPPDQPGGEAELEHLADQTPPPTANPLAPTAP